MAKGKVLTIRKRGALNWEEALQGFIFFKQAQNVSERTLKDYRSHVGQFFKRFPEAFNSEKFLFWSIWLRRSRPLRLICVWSI